MLRQPVESSSLASVGYEAPTRTLEVEFRNGGVYRYLEVPPAVVRAFLEADSKGAFLNLRIKPHFRYVRLEPAAPAGVAARR